MPRALADAVFAGLSRHNAEVDIYRDPQQGRRIASRYRDLMRNARRHYCDEDITEAAALLGYQHPDVLAAMLSRARTPFQTMWIEWPLDAALRVVGQERDEDMAPERVGVLIERLDDEEPIYRMITLYAGAFNTPIVSPVSIIYHLGKPLTEVGADSESAKIMNRHHRLVLAVDGKNKYVATDVAFLLGSAYTKPDVEDDPTEIAFRKERCAALASHAAFVFSPLIGDRYQKALGGHAAEMTTESLYHTIKEQAGQWRMALSFLAIMNSRDRPVDETRWRDAAKRRFVGGQSVPFLEHIMVRLKLPRKIVVPRIVREAHAFMPRRRHEVEGHWKERLSSGDTACEHVWIDTVEAGNRQQCALCGRRRWWVNEFYRGSAEVGFVTKDRLLTRR